MKNETIYLNREGYNPSLAGHSNFGHAIQAMKDGYALSRKEWGDGNAVYLNAGSSDVSKETEERPEFFNGVKSTLFVKGDIGTVTRMPNINLKRVNGSIMTGWTPSQEDMLADDWMIV